MNFELIRILGASNYFVNLVVLDIGIKIKIKYKKKIKQKNINYSQ